MPSCCFLRGAKSQRRPGNKNPANILLSCINLLSFLNTPCFLFLQYTLCCNDSFVNKHDLALYFPSCVNTRLLLLKSNFIKILFCALQFFIKIKKKRFTIFTFQIQGWASLLFVLQVDPLLFRQEIQPNMGQPETKTKLSKD